MYASCLLFPLSAQPLPTHERTSHGCGLNRVQCQSVSRADDYVAIPLGAGVGVGAVVRHAGRKLAFYVATFTLSSKNDIIFLILLAF